MPIKTQHVFGVDGREEAALQRILPALAEMYCAKLPFKLEGGTLTIDFGRADSTIDGLVALADLVEDLRFASHSKLADKVYKVLDQELMRIRPHMEEFMPE